MIDLLQAYLLAFLRPFRNHRDLRQRRSCCPEGEALTTHLPFEKVLAISWLFAVWEGFYALVSLNLGQIFFDYSGMAQEWSVLLPYDIALYKHRTVVIGVLLKVAFFPMVFWFVTKLWKTLISFFAELFQVEGDIQRSSNEIVQQAMTSHVMLTIPIFGKMLYYLAVLVHLFAGLKENMRLSTSQAIVVLLSPAIIMLMLSSAFVVLIFYFISLIM